MMKRFIALTFLMGALSTPLLLADDISLNEASEIGVKAGAFFFEGDGDLDEDAVFGGQFSRYLSEDVSVEVSLLVGQTEIDHSRKKADLFLPSFEVHRHFTRSAIRPFLALGVGAIDVKRDFGKNDTDFAIPYGGGIKILLSRNFLARFDARHWIDNHKFS